MEGERKKMFVLAVVKLQYEMCLNIIRYRFKRIILGGGKGWKKAVIPLKDTFTYAHAIRRNHRRVSCLLTRNILSIESYEKY